MPLSPGPVILDLIGMEVSQEEREILQHPLVGGVILFSRNYESPKQVSQLCEEIRAARSGPLLITVDHEGGRVQRFRQGFTSLPAMGAIGRIYESNPEKARQLAEITGWIMAAELLAVGIDLSFAPVLDLNKELNTVIGDRAFHQQPEIVVPLARSIIKGMKQVGMAATGKHFPGHGSVSVDSHLALPIDARNLNTIAAVDLQPFVQLVDEGLDAIMPAHIVFSAVDSSPVGFSSKWLQEILRKQLNFSGVILSDDLNMEGADIAGGYVARANRALEAGCDMVLICNNRRGAINILDQLRPTAIDENKFKTLQGRFLFNFEELMKNRLWQEKHTFLLSTQEIT